MVSSVQLIFEWQLNKTQNVNHAKAWTNYSYFLVMRDPQTFSTINNHFHVFEAILTWWQTPNQSDDPKTTLLLNFELNLGWSNIESNIEWIIFWQNSNIELNQIGYRTSLYWREGGRGRSVKKNHPVTWEYDFTPIINMATPCVTKLPYLRQKGHVGRALQVSGQ